MTMDRDIILREHLARLLDWRDAHTGFEDAVDGLPPALRGKRPEGLPYSVWQLLEHMRRTQADILDFCLNANYVEREWPKDYWPESEEPPAAAAWTESVTAFRNDREQIKSLCANQK